MKEETQVMRQEPSLMTSRDTTSLMLTPVMNLQTAVARLREFQAFVDGYLQLSKDGGQDGGDYGVIPGVGTKKVLLKSGADKLCELYGLYDEYEIESREDFSTNLFYYKIKCTLKSRRDDSIVGSGLGSCSTYESKYRWRDSQRKCPKCEATSIIKGKEEFGGGWLCWAKKGGCGAKFPTGDRSIEGQVIGRTENPDIYDTVNTVLKMAKKRAKIDAVIAVTRSSGIFTQDLEEFQPEVMSKVAEPARTAADIEITPKSAEPEIPGSDCIDEGMAKNFHIEFKKNLRKEIHKQADELATDWLRAQGIKDITGKPSAYAIKKANFQEVRESAVEHARSL